MCSASVSWNASARIQCIEHFTRKDLPFLMVGALSRCCPRHDCLSLISSLSQNSSNSSMMLEKCGMKREVPGRKKPFPLLSSSDPPSLVSGCLVLLLCLAIRESVAFLWKFPRRYRNLEKIAILIAVTWVMVVALNMAMSTGVVEPSISRSSTV